MQKSRMEVFTVPKSETKKFEKIKLFAEKRTGNWSFFVREAVKKYYEEVKK